jgi:hypothetical protein
MSSRRRNRIGFDGSWRCGANQGGIVCEQMRLGWLSMEISGQDPQNCHGRWDYETGDESIHFNPPREGTGVLRVL